MAMPVPPAVKNEIRAVLLSQIGGVPVDNFPKDFVKLLGHRLEWRALGYNTSLQLFESIPDTVRQVSTLSF